jgi:trypsin
MRRRNLVPFIAVLATTLVVSSLAGMSGRQSPPAAPSAVLLPMADAPAASASGAGNGRIINGSKAASADENSRWRSISLLLHHDGRSAGICGAAFVTRRHLLTAAHCVTADGATTQLPTGELFVTNGVTDMSAIFAALRSGTRPTAIAQLVPIQRIHVHPAWDPRSFANDVALLQVGVDSRFSPTPMAGASEAGTWGGGLGRDMASGGGWIGGWGDTDYSWRIAISEQLMEANVPILPDKECADAWGGQFAVATMMCAGTLDTDDSYETSNGVDSCQGDSGGPLLAPATDGSMRIVGIISFGSLCASSYFPGVYARVDALRDWVETITGPASGTTDFPPPTPPAVVGGGDNTFAVTAPVGRTRLAARGATTLAWTMPTGLQVRRVLLNQRGVEYWTRATDPGATSFVLGHENVRPGESALCVEESGGTRQCAVVDKANPGPQAAAMIQSAVIRGGTMTLRGRAAGTTRTAQVRVIVSAGRSKAQSRIFTVPLRGYPRTRDFTTKIRWQGAPPKRLKVVTQVRLGGKGKWYTFTSHLR